jgi:hypothetical protein
MSLLLLNDERNRKTTTSREAVSTGGRVFAAIETNSQRGFSAKLSIRVDPLKPMPVVLVSEQVRNEALIGAARNDRSAMPWVELAIGNAADARRVIDTLRLAADSLENLLTEAQKT